MLHFVFIQMSHETRGCYILHCLIQNNFSRITLSYGRCIFRAIFTTLSRYKCKYKVRSSAVTSANVFVIVLNPSVRKLEFCQTHRNQYHNITLLIVLSGIGNIPDSHLVSVKHQKFNYVWSYKKMRCTINMHVYYSLFITLDACIV